MKSLEEIWMKTEFYIVSGDLAEVLQYACVKWADKIYEKRILRKKFLIKIIAKCLLMSKCQIFLLKKAKLIICTNFDFFWKFFLEKNQFRKESVFDFLFTK